MTLLQQVGRGIRSGLTGLSQAEIETMHADRDFARTRADLMRNQVDQQSTANARSRRFRTLLQNLLAPGSTEQPTGPDLLAGVGGQTGAGEPLLRNPARGDQLDAFRQLAVEFPQEFDQIAENMGLIDTRRRRRAADFAFQARNAPPERREALIRERARQIEAEGGDPSDTLSLLGMDKVTQDRALMVAEMAALEPSVDGNHRRPDDVSTVRSSLKKSSIPGAVSSQRSAVVPDHPCNASSKAHPVPLTGVPEIRWAPTCRRFRIRPLRPPRALLPQRIF